MVTSKMLGLPTVQEPRGRTNMTRQYSEFITWEQLRMLGWTDGLIQRFLGEPDEVRAQEQVSLYRYDRVQEAEALPECGKCLTVELAMREWQRGEVLWRTGTILGTDDWMTCNEPMRMLGFLRGS